MHYYGIRAWTPAIINIALDNLNKTLEHALMKNIQRLTHRYIIVTALLSCTLVGAYAQNVYRVTQPDGRVVYTDTPRANDNAVPVGPTGGGTVSSSSSIRRQNTSTINTDQLPYQVKRAYQAYPATLFTTNNCQPCTDARNYLIQAGIPFIEYTATTVQDMEALKKETAQTTGNFPVLKIGNKVLVNFQKQEWENYLYAAGYPKTNMLPPSYVNPAPQPLTDPAAKPEPQVVEPHYVAPTRPAPVEEAPQTNIRF